MEKPKSMIELQNRRIISSLHKFLTHRFIYLQALKNSFIIFRLFIFFSYFRHYHSMEVFATFDIINDKGEKVAEGHKASFCLEDNLCEKGIEKKYACASYGDQGS